MYANVAIRNSYTIFLLLKFMHRRTQMLTRNDNNARINHRISQNWNFFDLRWHFSSWVWKMPRVALIQLVSMKIDRNLIILMVCSEDFHVNVRPAGWLAVWWARPLIQFDFNVPSIEDKSQLREKYWIIFFFSFVFLFWLSSISLRLLHFFFVLAIFLCKLTIVMTFHYSTIHSFTFRKCFSISYSPFIAKKWQKKNETKITLTTTSVAAVASSVGSKQFVYIILYFGMRFAYTTVTNAKKRHSYERMAFIGVWNVNMREKKSRNRHVTRLFRTREAIGDEWSDEAKKRKSQQQQPQNNNRTTTTTTNIVIHSLRHAEHTTHSLEHARTRISQQWWEEQKKRNAKLNLGRCAWIETINILEIFEW